MNKQIYYRTELTDLYFLGRNGVGNTKGLDILTTQAESIIVAPITGRGNIGRAEIEIPYDAIPELISILIEAIRHTNQTRAER